MNFEARKESTTQLVVNTSPKASTEAAFNAEEFIEALFVHENEE